MPALQQKLPSAQFVNWTEIIGSEISMTVNCLHTRTKGRARIRSPGRISASIPVEGVAAIEAQPLFSADVAILKGAARGSTRGCIARRIASCY